MELFFLLSLLLHIFILVSFSHFFFSRAKNPALKGITFVFILFGISFFLSALFYFLWLFSFTPFSLFDFGFINASLLVFRTILLLVLFSYLLRNDSYFFLLSLYLFLVLSYLFSFSFSHLLFVLSFLIIFILSLQLYSIKGYEKVGLSGIGYSFVASILFLLYFIQVISLPFVLFVINVFFFVFLFEILFLLRYKNDFILKRRFFKEESSFIVSFLKYFVFIVIIVNFVFIATISIHELGHAGMTYFVGCSHARILYDGGFPHTEILCQSSSLIDYILAILGGLFLPLIFSLFLFFGGGTFIREIGLLVVGFNFLLSHKDFIALGFSETIALFIGTIGLCIIIIAIGFLVRSRVELTHFLAFTRGHKDFYTRGNT